MEVRNPSPLNYLEGSYMYMYVDLGEVGELLIFLSTKKRELKLKLKCCQK
jgi:hypothetical protein